ncbi:hypothetical protein R0381_000589 [Jeongeupia wiesaeckerbachi]|uniref:hypothetical protein n=1 Tax=Jeongeupia wiesaeckerbachi TaxID=3051218 RepID=UPI003D809B39
MDRAVLHLPELLKKESKQALDILASSLDGSWTSMIIATSDGFEVAARSRNGVEVSKLAAMGCSISALGVMCAHESGIGLHRSVIVEATEGLIVIIEIPNPELPMILTLAVNGTDVLGQVLYQARRAAKGLEHP